MMEEASKLFSTFDTGSGFWNPLVWLLAFIIIFLVIYIIRGYGQRKYKKDSEQTKSFLSGTPEYSKEEMHVKADNVYWGFTESMKWIYNLFEKMHTGNVSDYALWFVIIMGVLFLLIGVL